ncbi:hypothetical protein H480_36703, partial [Amycolatopsis vancoresmycina DSM 44592]
MKPSLAVRASCWSADHAGAVVALWLVFVAVTELPGLAGGHRLGDGSLADPDVAATWWPLVAAPVAVLLSAPFSRLLLVSALFTTVVTTVSAALLDTVSESVAVVPRTGDAALLVVVTVSVQHMLFAFHRRREALAGGNDAARAARIVASTAGNAALVSGSGVAASL